MPQLIPEGYRTDGSNKAKKHGVQAVGRVQFLFEHPLLSELATSNSDEYGDLSSGQVYLTGFKLEEVLFSADGFIDNAKLIPMLNGDTMTLTNSCTAGTITIPATRTAAGINGGDLVSIANFIRSQGDSTGGTLTVSWYMNGEEKEMIFKNVCVQRCPPLRLAGNDLPSLDVVLTYADFHDGDYPTWN